MPDAPPSPPLNELSPPLIWADLWARLTAGRDHGKHPFRTGTLATADALGRPDARTVVLRALDEEHRTIDFQTDRRSPKFAGLQRNAQACWLAWDAGDQLQLRMQAAVMLHTRDSVADGQWAAVPDEGRRMYRASVASGAPLDGPDKPPPYGDTDGREHFAVCRCVLTSIEWLKMTDGGWKRLRFHWPDGEIKWVWLAP